MGRPTQQQTQDSLLQYKKVCKEFKIKPLEPVEKLGTKILHECHCGEQWSVKPSKVKAKPRCNRCAEKEVGANNSRLKKGQPAKNKTTCEDFLRQLKAAGTTRKLVGAFHSMGRHVMFKCTVCKDVSSAYPKNALNYGCAVCAGSKKKTLEVHKQELSEFTITPLTYAGARERATYRCTVCTFEWESMPTNLLKNPRCPSCSPFSSYGLYTLKHRKKFYKVRSKGELVVLERLLTKYKPSDIKCDLTDGTPTVFLKSGSKHRPDFYIKSENRLIEVKSAATAGLVYKTGNLDAKVFALLKRKRQSAIDQGFKYNVLIVDGWRGLRLKLPKNWHELPIRDLRRLVKGSEHYRRL